MLKLNNEGEGIFYLLDDEEETAQMVISIKGHELTAHHTEVFPRGEGKGLGKQLLSEMSEYARKEKLKVVALCPFVHAQFKKHPTEYHDIMATP